MLTSDRFSLRSQDQQKNNHSDDEDLPPVRLKEIPKEIKPDPQQHFKPNDQRGFLPREVRTVVYLLPLAVHPRNDHRASNDREKQKVHETLDAI